MTLEDRSSTRARIRAVTREVVKPAVFSAGVPLTVSAYHVHGEPVGAAGAITAPYQPFAVGERWGGRWDTTWFHMAGVIPPTWAGERVVARINLGGSGMPSFTAEGLVWCGGEPVQGLHAEHRELLVAACAAGGDAVDFYVEAAANPVPPWTVADWPSWAADFGGTPMYSLDQADLAIVDPTVEALWLDLKVLLELLDQVPDEPRNSRVLRALSAAVGVLDRSDVRGTAAAARAELAPVLAVPARDGHHITAVGHAHIDTAWLWPIRETRRKCARTFANQLRLMDEYPEHRFACSQAQQYEWMRDGYPALWERIRARVADGRWEPVGGMWVEPDTNVPSGESLVRQLVYGKRFFLDAFGVETHELWIPDVFGYSAALPQIAAQAGVRALITQKLSWNSVNRFPHHTFWWEGHDGSRLLTHFPPAATYNGNWEVPEVVGSMRTFTNHGVSDRSLYPFGYGDGGGGPTREMLERARRMGDLEGVPRAQIGSVAGFLDAVDSESAALPVWVGELYLEYHRGTYTTHADVKRGNRRGEEALRAAEMWSVAAGGDYPAAALDDAWKRLLVNQFHDIIPGSSIGWVYDDARADYEAIETTTKAIIDSAVGRLAGSGPGRMVFNAASHGRREVVDVPGVGLSTVDVPACGWAQVRDGVHDAAAFGGCTVTDRTLANEHLRVEWDADGVLTSVWDIAAGREVLSDPGNVLQLHPDRPLAFDAWDIDISALERVTELREVESIEVVQRHPLRSEVRITRAFGASRVVQVLRLDAGSRRLEFHTTIDWQERHQLLKVAFPVAVRSPRATYEIQHGYLDRPTHWNTSWDVARFEVCAHRWADLSEAGYGVAVLNDAKYGYDVHGDTLRLTLLRGPGYPDPDADRGTHRFAYALLPHTGDPQTGRVREEAEAFNLPLRVVPGSAPGGTVVSVDRPGVSVEAVKRADRGAGVVVRLCEVSGGRGPATIRLGVPFSTATKTDLLERDLEPVAVDGGAVRIELRPFELVTLRFV